MVKGGGFRRQEQKDSTDITPPSAGSTSAAQPGQNDAQLEHEKVPVSDYNAASAALPAQGGTGSAPANPGSESPCAAAASREETGSTPASPGSACAAAASRRENTNTADPDDKGKKRGKKKHADMTQEEKREVWRLAQQRSRNKKKKAKLAHMTPVSEELEEAKPAHMTPEELEEKKWDDLLARLDKAAEHRKYMRLAKRASRARAAEKEAKKKAEQEARAKAEEEKAEVEARVKAEQEAREKAEEEAREKAKQEARAKAEQEARAKALEEQDEAAAKKAEKEKKAEKDEVFRISQPSSSADTCVEELAVRVLEENNLVCIGVPKDGNCLFISILLAYICRLMVDSPDGHNFEGPHWLSDMIAQSDGPLAGGDPLFIKRYEGRPHTTIIPPSIHDADSRIYDRHCSFRLQVTSESAFNDCCARFLTLVLCLSLQCGEEP